MIIREILKDKAKVLSMFDYFNDTKDTVEFLRRKGEDAIAEELIAMDKEYWRVRNLVKISNSDDTSDKENL